MPASPAPTCKHCGGKLELRTCLQCGRTQWGPLVGLFAFAAIAAAAAIAAPFFIKNTGARYGLILGGWLCAALTAFIAILAVKLGRKAYIKHRDAPPLPPPVPAAPAVSPPTVEAKPRPADSAPAAPTSGQNVAIVRDKAGGACGVWIRNEQAAQDRDLLSMILVSLKVPEEIRISVLSGDYRVVPNTKDDQGGAFVMFGNAVAPGEATKPAVQSNNCNKCGRQLQRLGASSLVTGGAMNSLLEASPYPCKSCGTPFCIDCMREMRKDPCPHCGKTLGW